ncbi:hypothetical protein PR003_g15501 [Phytophthora rubi]|uniref:Uncharacterized protein n=1 Tax=Phytophthora rubi TaxID=129364 RepID=A0A6A3KFQ6_9STRA|nr:hypothetical protein PR002_g16557 [Phytophthora rubi]KAE9010196.1 hypothetical protein PR001_g16239 [Phytophthora rubi]KAE9329678.1 hypothetical protein PR003_g15501 [Phytophthora rubi]
MGSVSLSPAHESSAAMSCCHGGAARDYARGWAFVRCRRVTPLSPTAAVAVPVKIPSREPQWMLHQPPRTLLEDGVEGRMVAGSSPRSIFTALTSKRPRRERDADGEEDDSSLSPRFVEHLETHGDRSATAPSPLFRTEKPKLRCTCNGDLEGGNDDLEFSPQCPRHGSLDNNREEEGEQQEDLPKQESQVEDVTKLKT